MSMRIDVLKTLILFCCISFTFLSECFARTWEDGIPGQAPSVWNDPACPGVRGCLEIVPGMRYRYYLPENYDPTIKYPLLLFLHGSGESGTDNELHVSLHISSLIDKTYQEYPAIFVAPQLPESTGWGSYNDIDATAFVLQTIMSDHAVDRNRIYITGLSMGGFGAMQYLHENNAYGLGDFQFAAAAPTAGSFVDSSVANILSQTPTWIAHGARDTVVSPDYARQSFNLLRNADLNAPIEFTETGAGGPMAVNGLTRYTEYPNTAHGSWGPLYSSDEFYEWMFAQTLVPEPSSGILFGMAMGLCVLRSRPKR